MNGKPEVEWNGHRWTLDKQAGRYPYVLRQVDGDGRQDIGDKTLEAAKRKAELWLTIGPYPRPSV